MRQKVLGFEEYSSPRAYARAPLSTRDKLLIANRENHRF
jgi:hypothetical protein